MPMASVLRSEKVRASDLRMTVIIPIETLVLANWDRPYPEELLSCPYTQYLFLPPFFAR